MRYLLDTTVLIDHAAGWPEAIRLIDQLFGEPHDLLVCDAVVTEALSKGGDREANAIGRLIDALEYVSTHPDAARWAGASHFANCFRAPVANGSERSTASATARGVTPNRTPTSSA